MCYNLHGGVSGTLHEVEGAFWHILALTWILLHPFFLKLQLSTSFSITVEYCTLPRMFSEPTTVREKEPVAS